MGANAAQPSASEPMDLQLNSPKFLGLLWIHVFTVAGSCALWWTSASIGRDLKAGDSRTETLVIAGMAFCLGYVLLAWWSGALVDRLAPRVLVLATQLIQICAVIVASIATNSGSWSGLLAAMICSGAAIGIYDTVRLVLMGDWFGQQKIVRANGVLWICGWFGALAGVVGASLLIRWTGHAGVERFFSVTPISLIGCVVIGGFGLSIIATPRTNETANGFHWTQLFNLWRNLRAILTDAALLRMSIGVALFWGLAVIGLFTVPRYAAESSGWTAENVQITLIALSVGIVVGAWITGWSSMGRIELGLSPWGGLITVIGFFILATRTSDALFAAGAEQLTFGSMLGIALAGLGGSMFILPIVSYLQHHSAPEQRGLQMSATNMLVGIAVAAGGFLFSQTQELLNTGRLSNLPQQYQTDALSESQQATVRDAIQSLAESKNATGVSVDEQIKTLRRAVDHLRPKSTPPSDTVAPLEIEMRRAGLARLLWAQSQAQSAAGQTLDERDYRSLFPDDLIAQSTAKRILFQTQMQPRLTSRQIFLVLGILAIPIFLYSVWRVPQAMARLPLWWAFRCLYRVRVNGLENIPANGGAVLVINHSTWMDGLIILLMSSRRIRMIAWAGNFKGRTMKVLARFAQVILITGGPKSIQKGLSEGRKALQRGELVGIFPEGGITRTGQVLAFRPGLMRILEQMPVPIVPVYIDQIWGSIFTYAGGTSIWKWPNSIRHRLTINIGPSLWRPENIYQVRRAVQEEGADAVNQRQPPFACPAQSFIRACKKRRFRAKIADSLGQNLTGGMLLARSLTLRDILRKHVLSPDEKIVGVLIPPSTGGVLANMALALDHRVTTHLNYSLSERLINECLRIAGVKHVLTTRRVMEKFQFKLNCEVCYLDDLKEKATTGMKLRAFLRSFVLPAAWLEFRLGLRNVPTNELLSIIFTSGSTGVPKGVMLSQQNIATNVDAIGQVICLNARDALVGALPFFHSFGYTITLWGAMSLDVRGLYHFNPLDAQQVGKLTRTYGGTVLLGTPTFLRTYLRKCTPDDFASLDTVVVGAEKLPQELAVAFDHRFGIRPVEGYGTTELSPLVSVNIPPSRAQKNFQSDSKEGSVGRTVPNVVAKITDMDDPTRELGPNASGMLWIKGPNVMLGYLHRPDLTAEVIVDGWYCTGDIAQIDDAGFITLTGRMSRFSKIGGEMIPHVQIEEALTSILNEKNYDEQKIAVTAVPDAKRGERLVVLHTEMDDSPAELCKRLREIGLPNLFVPSEDSFFQVETIPLLGSGKLDLKKMKEVALQVSGNPTAH